MVSLFEEHQTRVENHFSLENWGKIEPIERAMMVALRRIKIQMENLQAEAEIKNAERQRKHK